MTNPRRRNFAVITLRWHAVDVGVAQHRALPAPGICLSAGRRPDGGRLFKATWQSSKGSETRQHQLAL